MSLAKFERIKESQIPLTSILKLPTMPSSVQETFKFGIIKIGKNTPNSRFYITHFSKFGLIMKSMLIFQT